MLLKYDNVKVEFDAEKTREFYSALDEYDCDCAGCRNYMKATSDFPAEVAVFFDLLGMDVRKASEIIPWFAENEGKAMNYGGFYHLYGRIVSGGECWKENGEVSMYEIADGYSIGFTEDISMREDVLGEPALQMEIFFKGIPWLLDETNPY